MTMNAALTSWFASEAGHWYKPDGTPCYDIIGANGKLRPVTLRDAKKLGLFPSVTGIIKCASAPGLEKWKRDQLLMSALTLPRVEGESLDAFAKRVAQDSEEQSRKARERGTQIHAEIEVALKGREVSEFAAPVLGYLRERFGEMEWFPERSFACAHGFGGKTDLHGKGVVVDFKTKDFGDGDDVKGYDEHLMQLAACAMGLGEDLESVVLMNLFVSTRKPGLIVPVEWPDLIERARAWTMFQHLLGYWKAVKRPA